jgi:3-oxoacyl-[acyl-carrier protein] reductase
MASVLVTGSSRGIGRAIALRLAKDGFEVVVHCHSNTAAAQLVCQEIVGGGGVARLLQFDVSDRTATRAALEEDLAAHEAYYGVVCNAGVVRDKAFPALSDDDWDVVLRTNLDSFYNVLQPVMMPMIRRRKPGRIVTLSSMSGITGNRGQVNYSASKGGLIAASKALAIELAKRHITVNCVAPGLIETEMIASVSVEEAMKLIPMRRMGTVDDVAGLVSYLMSEEASYITRQVIAINGGMA